MDAVEGTRRAVDPSHSNGKVDTGTSRRFGSNGHAGSNGYARRGRSRNPRITVVMPTLNEAKNLPAVIARMPLSIHELIVVDARSEDETVAVVRGLWPGTRVIEQSGTGKGDALGLGFRAAAGDVIVTLDADGSTDPAELPRFVAALAAGVDFAKGSRFLPGGGSDDITWLRRIGARRLTTLVNVLFRTRYTDLCYGYNAFWRDCLGSFTTDCNGFEVETLMNISAARAGLVVAEVPSFEYARVHGQSHLRTVRDGVRVLRTILSQRMRRRPRPDSDVSAAHLTLAPQPDGAFHPHPVLSAEPGSAGPST